MLVTDIPIPDNIRASVMYRRGTCRYSKPRLSCEPPPAFGTLVPLPLFVLAAIPSVAGVLCFLALWTHQFMLVDFDILAEGGLGLYE